MNSVGSMCVGTISPNGFRDRMDLSIAQLLREQYPAVRLRERVRNDPLLERVTIGSLMGDPLRLDAFMEEFRKLPQCGATQVSRLREVLFNALRGVEPPALTAVPPLQPALVPSASSDVAAQQQPHPTQGIFYPDYVDALEDVYFRMWRLAQFDPFVYIPSTLPEFAKTPEVLAVELGPGRDLKTYLQRLAGLRTAFEGLDAADGVILLDGQTLETVLTGQGRYRVLSRDAIERQGRALRETMARLPQGVTCRVCDFEVSGLSSAAFVGNKAVLYAMGGYAVLDDARLVASMQPRINAAMARGRSLTDFLDARR